MKGLLVVVSGPSGVGKGTLLGALLAKRKDCVFSISATTRDPRPGETHGQHYHFLDHSTFTAWVEQGRFLEWNKVFDQFYGTPREFVEHQRIKGLNVILDVDVQGGTQVMESEADHVSIFIAPPDLETLRQRLTGRGTETAEQIQKRLLTARVEMRAIEHYTYCVTNDNLEQAANDLQAIISAEWSRTSRLKESGRLPRLSDHV
jgi:guanylate kinase